MAFNGCHDMSSTWEDYQLDTKRTEEGKIWLIGGGSHQSQKNEMEFSNQIRHRIQNVLTPGGPSCTVWWQVGLLASKVISLPYGYRKSRSVVGPTRVTRMAKSC